MLPQIASIDTIVATCTPIRFQPKANGVLFGGLDATVNWTFQNCNPIASTAFQPDSVLCTVGGSHRIEMAVTNACGTTRASTTLVVQEKTQAQAEKLKRQFCNTDADIQLNGTPASGGRWVGQQVSTSGVFSPSQVPIGSGQIILEYHFGQGACETLDTFAVAVGGTDVTLGVEKTVCVNVDSLIRLSDPNPTGGVWRGNGIVDSLAGVVAPQQAGVGRIPMTYIYTESATGCRNAKTQNFNVLEKPNALFAFDTLLCQGLERQFRSQNSNVSTYLWQFGDMNNSTSNQATPTFRYDSSGRFAVQLIVGSGEGCVDSIRQFVSVKAAPVLAFVLSDTIGCSPLSVAFQNNSQAEGYHWSFGNGSTSVATNPTPVTYSNAQNFRDTTFFITLRASNQGCAEVQATKSVTLYGDIKNEFGVTSLQNCSPAEAEFSNTSKGKILRWAWDFGNGNSSTDAMPAEQIYKTDSTSKEYTITLVTEGVCRTDTSQQKITVVPSGVRAFAQTDKNSGCQPLQVQFTDFSRNGNKTTYDFGDGTTFEGGNPTHIFEKAGDFRVIQYVTQGCGYDSMIIPIKVLAAPTIAFGYSQTQLCDGQTVQFQNRSSSAQSIVWDFGDSTATSREINPQHEFRVGTFTVVLTGQNGSNGCLASDSATIDIRPALTLTPDSLVIAKCVNTKTGAIILSNDQRTNGGRPPYTFSLNRDSLVNQNGIFSNLLGNQDYFLKIKDSRGCEDSMSIYLEGLSPLTIDVGADLLLRLGDSVTVYAVANTDSVRYSWSPKIAISCDTCASVTLNPLQETVYTVKATDNNGCTTTDILKITVTATRNVFLPNVFSPNNDGINDYFFPQSTAEVEKISYLRVFNRWGGLVFNQEDFQPNEYEKGFNGVMSGKELEPQVFAYIMEVVFKDGKIGLLKGDVTLVR